MAVVTASGHGTSLDGKVAVVTGGARGIGHAYARGLADAGAAVVIADLLEEEGRRAANAIVEGGGRAIFVAADVTSVESTAELASTAAEVFGGVDILVNNAAVFAELRRSPLTELPVERWTKVLAVNVTGAWLCLRAVVPLMRERGGGSVINQASIAAYGLHGGGMLDYATSKTAVIGLTKSAAKELGADRIRVNAICPGGVATEASLELAGGDPTLIERMAGETQLLGEVIRPADLVPAMLFLASDDARFMTGQTVVVDGGRYFLG